MIFRGAGAYWGLPALKPLLCPALLGCPAMQGAELKACCTISCFGLMVFMQIACSCGPRGAGNSPVASMLHVTCL